jgi:hypothetical protein
MSADPGVAAESQGRIFLNDTIHAPVGGPPAEKERAFQTCRMVNEVWGGKV